MRSLSIRRPQNLGPFATLLATLVTMLFVQPFIEGTVFGISRFRLFTVAILFAGVYAVSRRRRVFWFGAAMALAALGIEAGVHVRPGPALVLTNFALSIVFLFFLGSVILYAILDERTSRSIRSSAGSASTCSSASAGASPTPSSSTSSRAPSSSTASTWSPGCAPTSSASRI